MSAYADLIPGPSLSRRRSAYDDLLPGGAPAASVQPAEDARLAGDAAVTLPRVADVARQINDEILAQQPARATMTRRGGVRVLPPNPADTGPYEDASGNLYELPGAEWGQVARSIVPAAGAQIRSAIANLRRMATEGSIASREAVLRPETPRPEGTTLPGRVRRAIEVQQAQLERERSELPAIETDAAAAMQDLAAVTPKDMSTGQKAVFAAGSSAPTTLAGLGAGILTRNPVLAMLIAGGSGAVVQGGATYGEAREKGAPHAQAATAAGIDAILEGVGEALPLKLALAPGSAFAKRLAQTIAAEAGQEAATQVMQDLNAFLTYNPEMTLADAIENLKVATLAGGLGGATYAGIGGAANIGRKEQPAMHLEGAEAAQQARRDEDATEERDIAGDRIEQRQGTDPLLPPVGQDRDFIPGERPRGAPAGGGDRVGQDATQQAVAPSPYADLVPSTADLQGRIEPTLKTEPVVEQEEAEQIGAPNPAEMTAAEINRELDRLDKESTAVTDQLIAEGRGEERPSDTRTKTDPLSKRFMEVAGRQEALRSEIAQRYGPNPPSRLPMGRGFGRRKKPQAQSLGAPASTTTVAAGTITVPPSSTKTTVPKGQARPDAIRAAMRSLFGAPLNEKNVSKKYLGIYKIKPQTVRLQNRNDLRTASHEIGHHISNLNRPFRKVMRSHQQELISIAPRAYIAQAIQKHGSLQAALTHGDVRRLLIEEGFAEFIAEYLTAPATIQAKVPAFFADFETWLEQNPRYAEALQRVQDMIGAHQALPAADKILAKVGTFKPPLGQRAATLASKDTWDTFAQAVLDKWHPLKTMVADLMPGMAASKNPYMAARLLAGDAAIIEDWISNFTSPFDYAKRLDGKNYGMPLKKILEPILAGGEQEVNNFKAYLVARRAAELKKVGKENLFTSEEIAEGLKLETSQKGRSRLFEATANLIYEYNDRLLDYAVEGGLLAPDVAAKFKQYANYIPFFREPEGDAKGGGRGDPFKRLKGGTANLRDPIANLIQNTASIIHATNRNAMVAKAAELAKAVPGGGRWLETVRLPQEAHNLATQRILDELQAQGLKIDPDTAKDLAAMQTFFTPSGKGDDRTRTIVYKDGGQLKAVQVNDLLLWKTLGNIPPLEMDLIVKMLAFPAQTLRAGVVLDPTFMVRNFVRDTLSSMVQSKGAFIPVVSTAQGIKMMAQQKDAYRLWRAFGGAFADQFRDAEEAAAIVQRMAKRGSFDPASIITPTRWLDALKRVGSFTESGSRIGEFAATYKPGDIDSALQAALNSREVSTDFGMRGGSEAIQFLTRITPFMNPAMQGLYKTARVLSAADGKAAAAKAAIVGANMALVSIALALMNGDEDWYRQIEEWEKTTYWHFKIGDNVYRIAKPFEYGTLFASIPEAIALLQQGKEGWQDFKKRMLQALGQAFGFRVIPQVAALLAEPWANKSLFTGRKLVPDRQERLEPGLQAHPGTSKVAQVVGEAVNVSPAVIDNAVRNMFGTIGVHAETVADLLLEQTGAFPPGRERGWQTWPALKAFVRDPDNPNTKQQRDFYEALEKYRRAVLTVKEYRNRGEDAKAERYAEEKADELAMAKHAEKAAQRLAKLRKTIRSIEWDREMSPREKREVINEQNAEMQAIVEEQTRLYQAAKKSYIRPATQGGQ